MIAYLKKEFNFSNYQIAQLKYFFLTLLSEGSKLVIMAFFFHEKLGIFFYCIAVLSSLRLSTGGIHCNTYIGCFLTTFFFVFISLWVTSLISLSTLSAIAILMLCAIFNYVIGPVSSSQHLPLSISAKKRVTWQAVAIISLHIFLLYNFNSFYLFHIGTWVIILHTLQLIIANFIKKGGKKDESFKDSVI